AFIQARRNWKLSNLQRSSLISALRRRQIEHRQAVIERRQKKAIAPVLNLLFDNEHSPVYNRAYPNLARIANAGAVYGVRGDANANFVVLYDCGIGACRIVILAKQCD